MASWSKEAAADQSGRCAERRRNGGVRDFLEGEYSAGTHQLRQGAQDGDGIRKELQDETAHGRVERIIADDFTCVGLRESHVVQASIGHTRSSASDRAQVAFDAYDFSRRTNQFGRKHGHVSDAGTDIQDALARTNAGFAEELFGEGSKPRSLPNEALVFRVSAAESVMGSGIGCRHDGPGLYHPESPRL